MSVSTLLQENGHVVADLSIGNKANTAKMPSVSFADVATDGEFVMLVGDRPYFWFNGQWNPILTLADIPPPPPPVPIYAYGAAYVYQEFLINPYEEKILNAENYTTEQYSSNMPFDGASFDVQQSGIYNCNIQATYRGLSSYYSIDYELYLYPVKNGSTYLFNTGWRKGSFNIEWITDGTSSLVYLEAGDKVDCRVYFAPGTNNGPIWMYGQDPNVPEALGLCTYFQLSYVAPLP